MYFPSENLMGNSMFAEKYYTSDYDLSEFSSSQYGVGFKYVDIFSSFKILQLGLKSADIRYSSYTRNTGLKANILTLGVKFVVDWFFKNKKTC